MNKLKEKDKLLPESYGKGKELEVISFGNDVLMDMVTCCLRALSNSCLSWYFVYIRQVAAHAYDALHSLMTVLCCVNKTFMTYHSDVVKNIYWVIWHCTCLSCMSLCRLLLYSSTKKVFEKAKTILMLNKAVSVYWQSPEGDTYAAQYLDVVWCSFKVLDRRRL